MRMYLPPQQMKNTISVGRFTVGMILVVSLFIRGVIKTEGMV